MLCLFFCVFFFSPAVPSNTQEGSQAATTKTTQKAQEARRFHTEAPSKPQTRGAAPPTASQAAGGQSHYEAASGKTPKA